MKRQPVSGHILPIATTALLLALLVAAWQFYVSSGAVSAFILPPPRAVLRALRRLLEDAATWRDLATTLVEAVSGFGIASVCGIAVGVVLGKNPMLERALQPILVAIQVTPKIVLIPLFILWFGFGVGAKIVIAAVLAFLPVMSNTLLGVKSIARGHQEVMSSLGAGRFARFWLLELPSAMPYVLTGMEVGIILAMIGAIVGEFLAGSDGLGHLAVAKLNAFEVDSLFGVIVLLGLAGALLYLIVAALRRLLVGWHSTAGPNAM